MKMLADTDSLILTCNYSSQFRSIYWQTRNKGRGCAHHQDQNGFIQGYEVLYKEKGREKVFSFNATNTNTIITHLKPNTLYCIQVRGFTNVGKSPLSPCFNVRTLYNSMSSLNLVWFIIILELRKCDLRRFLVGKRKKKEQQKKIVISLNETLIGLNHTQFLKKNFCFCFSKGSFLEVWVAHQTL